MIRYLSYAIKSLLTTFLVVTFFSCGKNSVTDTLFQQVSASHSNINFENTLKSDEDFNIIEYLYFYNGGGVSVGDINNDGLPDIYFTGNQVENKLYLNQGNFLFEDITARAGVAGAGNWKTGTTMADVNGDGWLDIFVCGVGNYKKFNGRNQLFINNGDLTFTDKTDEYGLAFEGFSTQASFFDYDNDGDLDMYLVNHSVHTRRSYGRASLRFESDSLAGDKLYRNDLVPKGDAYFTEVTKDAGILNSQIGYGLSVGISDLNNDGYLDIYVCNDFNENDYLYINQQDGTFRQELEKSLPHSSRFSMGNDIADINNDALPDIVTLDMLPRDEAVIKTTAGEDVYEIYDFKLQYGYHYQFLRNTLQLNRGADTQGNLMFSDIAPYAGVEATDWSWAPLLADFDNDGNKDLFVSNGIVGRPNDLDYINFISRDSAQHHFSDQKLFEQMPSGKVPNAFFKNLGELKFQDVSSAWIGNESTLSNGAAYSDLDNDGDLDLVVNNINQEAFLYRNESQSNGNFLKLKLEGDAPNRFGVGAKITVFSGHKKIFHENVPVRGWLSSVEPTVHIGLGNMVPDSVVINWPGGKAQVIKQIQTNHTFVAKQADASFQKIRLPELPEKKLLTERSENPFFHKENNFVAFSTERLIPHMLSTQGPKMAIGDVNGDGLDDIFICGAAGQSSEVLLQNDKGYFLKSEQPALVDDAAAEHVDAVFADVDGDKLLDLIVVSGGQEFSLTDKRILPRLYLNRNGRFIQSEGKLPEIYVNASCVAAEDIDSDGDVDLFIGGRVVPGKYGVTPSSYILKNNGSGIFVDATRDVLTDASPLGMVTDALWADVNNDGLVDLVAVGEWMPITILEQNASGTFDDKTQSYGLANTGGWWNTIEATDLDQDGNIDFVAGNLGLNSRLRSSIGEPVSVYIGDIDNNNSLDHILTYYNQGKRYPFISRDQLVKQLPSMRRQFLKYSSFKDVRLEDIVPPTQQEKFVRGDAKMFSSVLLKNNGQGEMTIRPLPTEAQLFPIFSFCIDDLNGDGKLDIMAIGNFDATQPEFGRYDAGYGVVLLAGNGDFISVAPQKSGFILRGEGRDIKVVTSAKKEKIYVTARNNAGLSLFNGSSVKRLVIE